MAGKTVGSFNSENLSALFGGGALEIRKSTREGAKFPLYLSTKIGPLPVNTRSGQDALLELGVFNGAPGVAAQAPAGAVGTPAAPPPSTATSLAKINPEAAGKSRWFSHDDDLGI